MNYSINQIQNKIVVSSLLLIILLCSFVVPEKRAVNVVFIGDSITQGAGLKMPATEAPPAQAAAYLQQLNGIGEVKFSNQGVSGFTTINFLPAIKGVFNNVINAANNLHADQQAQLVFSIMLGTNDSAINGPMGAPVSSASYYANMKTIADSLLSKYPGCKLVIHHPIWYSPNTYNGAKYLQEGLDRLQSYFPEIKKLVKAYSITHPAQVFTGDQQAFKYFKKHYQSDFQHEEGKQGTFYLHPNKAGAMALGHFWANAIAAVIEK